VYSERRLPEGSGWTRVVMVARGRNRTADAIVAKVRLVREGGNFGGATRDQTDDLIVAKG